VKITYLHQYFNTPEMSGGTRSYEFAKRLVAMGHEVNIITSLRNSNEKNEWFKTVEDGVNVYWLPLPYSNKMNYRKRIKVFFKFAIYSAIKSSSLNSDIIFASSTPLTIAIPAIYASKKNKVPLVLEIRDVWPQVPIALNVLKNPILCFLARLLEKWSYKHSKSIVTLSPTMKKEIISKNVIHNKIAVIPNSSDLDNFKNKNFDINDFFKSRQHIKSKPFLLYAGTFGRVNDLSYSIKLAQALLEIKSNVNILLIGDGIEKNFLIEEAKKKNVYEVNLFIEKSVSKNEIFNSFSAATMCANFVIDKKETWANSANKFFDALAAGKPILLNHGGWMQDLVSNYDCGLCVHGKSMNNAALELHELMNDPSKLKKSGNNSLKLAKKFFNRDKLAEQLEKVLINTKEGNFDKIEKIAPGVYIN
tara:strand:- start:452 stop:1708 length:1257 start_codon:yes stop_codon:yes gene_type:complete